jgi:mannose-6-phosphate isomerase-like protein (cupin superfamily)
MAHEVREPVEGDGYAVAHIDALGDHYGFRKIRTGLGVTAFGINAICMPPSYAGPRHAHEQQEEIYFVHRGTMRMDFGDGSSQVLGPGGIARVDAATVRQVANASPDEDLIYVSAGGKDGYVGRDGIIGSASDTPGTGAGSGS